MLNPMKSYRLAFTPLSPLHIGCGEDYEPTNYVVDETRKFLYSFNPANAVLTPAVKAALRQAVAGTGYDQIKLINRFYAEHLDTYRPWADSVLPIGGSGVTLYRKMLSPTGNQRNTQYRIQRTAFEFHSGKPRAYLPGSGVKGVFKVALENRLNAGWRVSSPEAKDLLGGDFDRSPMRFVKVGDCIAEKTLPLTRVTVARRFFKKELKADGVQDSFETVVPAQYRIFEGEVLLADGMNTDQQKAGKVKNVPADLTQLMRDVHAYALDNWLKEIKYCVRDSAPWAQSVNKLLKALEPQIKAGRVALIRLGKNAGAESKTLHGDGVARIEIRHKDKTRETLDHSTTLWLTEDKPFFNDGVQYGNGLPFGWALCELDPEGVNQPLTAWCAGEVQRDSLNEARQAIENEWRMIRESRQKAVETRDRLIKEAKQMAENARLAEEAEARAKAELEAMPDELRKAKVLVGKLESAPGNVNPGTALFDEVKALLEEALSWENADYRKELAAKLSPLMKKRNMYQGKAAKLFKEQLRSLRGEA